MTANPDLVGFAWSLRLDHNKKGGGLERTSKNGFNHEAGKRAINTAGRDFIKKVSIN